MGPSYACGQIAKIMRTYCENYLTSTQSVEIVLLTFYWHFIAHTGSQEEQLKVRWEMNIMKTRYLLKVHAVFVPYAYLWLHACLSTRYEIQGVKLSNSSFLGLQRSQGRHIVNNSLLMSSVLKFLHWRRMLQTMSAVRVNNFVSYF